ncbi:hypothetical protein COF76_28410 [Bacillus wiedmannii]|nr:hypothetical protein COF76_28410 [Bacillus wiedmannii]
MFYGSIQFFIHSYLGAVLEFLFVIELDKKLYKILHTLSLVTFKNAGDTPWKSSIYTIVLLLAVPQY